MKVSKSDKLMITSKSMLPFNKVKGQIHIKVKSSYLHVQSLRSLIHTKFKLALTEVKHAHMEVISSDTLILI